MSDEQACENHPFKLEWLEHAERPQESPSLPSISSLTLRQVGKALSSAAINQSGAAGCQQVLQTSLQQAAIDRWLQHGTRCTVASFRFWPLDDTVSARLPAHSWAAAKPQRTLGFVYKIGVDSLRYFL
ncbi:hypothetical protein, partial [Stutzerimonas xanthomarina]|uniref:hypothetical protein n=1 Tax=Stutzerimonas xanthomarina TaxID=271420 RepID=UPI003AA82BEA